MLSLQNQVLVASPTMDADDAEANSVWAILDHTKDATTLFCLSRPIEPEVEIDIRRKVPHIPETMRILRGGWMDGFDKHMIMIHREPLKLEPAIQLAPKFRISMKPENVLNLEDSHAANCRIALGFETWDPEELEEEIREGLWNLRDVSHVGSTFFKVDPSELWARLQVH